MSGTSMDAIDAALVDFSAKQPVLIQYLQEPIGNEIGRELKSINKDSTIDMISRLDVEMGRLFANTAIKLIQTGAYDKKKILAIGSHGQTVFHRPEPPAPATLQIADPNIITHITGIPTIADFRRMDIAAGGQGAPLATIFHQYAFQHPNEDHVVLNIGGMANITCLPSKQNNTPVTGFDTGPGNVLLDEWISAYSGEKMDKDGQWAASGKINRNLLEHLLDDPYFNLTPPKSTGRDYFNLQWLKNKLNDFKQSLLPQDIQATLLELTTFTISTAIKKHAVASRELIVCGGGAHNLRMLESLANHLPELNVNTTRKFGIDPDAVEAMTFAWLAKCRLDRVPGNLPAVTGATSQQILGAVYLPAPEHKAG